jgi:hypothetical protein
MALKVMRRIEQPYMENGEQVYHPGQLLELDAPEELGGRLVLVEAEDAPAPPPAPAEAAPASTAAATAPAKSGASRK